jgi:hypothetical protein
MKNLFTGLLLFLSSAAFTARSQSIQVSGEGILPITITKPMFADMKQVVVMAKAHDEKVHRYSGVTIAEILDKAGVALGDSSQLKTVTSYILVTAADGYRAIYTLAEIDPLFAGRSIIIANREDKKPLAAEDGLFQVIVPGEKKHGRWVRQVIGIQIVQVK